jgi:hypothetical protein
MYRARLVIQRREAMQYLAPEDSGTGNIKLLQRWGALVGPTDHWFGICGEPGHENNAEIQLWVEKSKAWCTVKPYDYVVKEPDGTGYYPCEKGIFESAWEFERPPPASRVGD